MIFKVYEGQQVKLMSVYGNEYNGILTEVDEENGLISIRQLIFPEITFATEEVESIEMKTEKIITPDYLEIYLSWGI